MGTRAAPRLLLSTTALALAAAGVAAAPAPPYASGARSSTVAAVQPLAAVSTTAPPLQPLAPVQAVPVYEAEYPFMDYAGKPVHNEIARLQERLDRGEVQLHYGPAHGYLESVLALLDIDPASQVLVFSKTSLQIDAISPETPRALYFDDDTYVGWVQKTGVLEIVTMDADRGAVFYTLQNDGGPRLQRETLRCLTCHDTYGEMGGGVPLFLFESTYAVRDRQILVDSVTRETTDETPIGERWGGWYVTGEDGGTFHLGNIPTPATRAPLPLDARRGSLKSLAALFDTSPYLADQSDIVALLVLDHQVSVHNFIIHANYKARALLAREQPQAPAGAHWQELRPAVRARLAALVEPLVRGMLLVDAAPLPHRVAGDPGYAARFQARGPRDPAGRSLRDLDLNTRLFRYPMSFLIYSEGFDALPPCVREQAYRRFIAILTGQDRTGPYARLSAADRAAVLEILKATKPEFAQALARAS